MADVEEAISRSPLFSELSKKDVKQLAAAMTERSFPAGTAIIEKGKPGVGFFVIARGTATVSDGSATIGALKPGDHFGEIALIDEGPRMAEVMADTDLDCYALDRLAVPALRPGPPRRRLGSAAVARQADRARHRSSHRRVGPRARGSRVFTGGRHHNDVDAPNPVGTPRCSSDGATALSR